MILGKTLYVSTRAAWRAWLAKHHDSAKEIWLVYYRQAAGKPRIAYNDAVEEALCFGWIDSTVKNVDVQRYAQRFSPRKKGSRLSQMNKERIRRLIAEKRMSQAGLAAIAHLFHPASDAPSRFIIPPDILKALKADKLAWANFRKFPGSYQRIRVAYVEGQRRHGPEAFQRSLRNLVAKSARNRRFGYVKE